MSTPGETSLETVARFWGHACTFTYDPDDHPADPYAAHRIDGQGTIRAATTAKLLDAIKDAAATRPFGDAA